MSKSLTASTGIRKAAILTLLIGQEDATKLFHMLTEEEVQTIAREVAAIKSVPTAAGEEVLTEFHEMWTAAKHIASGGVDLDRRRHRRQARDPDLPR